MDPKASIYSLPTELHTQILEYLSDDLVYQIVSSRILPLWGDIIRDSSRLQRSRYVRFHSAWQNDVAVHRAFGETPGRFAVCCAVRNKVIEKYSMAWKLRRSSPQDGGMLSSMGNMSRSWSEIGITHSFILDEHFLLPFNGPLAQALKFPDEDVSVSKSQVDSDLRTTFLKVWAYLFKPPGNSKIIKTMSIFPSHLEDMTLRSVLKYIVRKTDKALVKAGVDVENPHYIKIWPYYHGLEVLVYLS